MGIVARVKAKAFGNDGAGIAENPPINKMMINWAEAPEDRHKLRTAGRNDAIRAEEPREAFVESETSKSNVGQPRVIAKR